MVYWVRVVNNRTVLNHYCVSEKILMSVNLSLIGLL